VTGVAVPGVVWRLRYHPWRCCACGCNPVNDPGRKTKASPRAADPVPEAERRRIGTVVHDDRGNASVRWRDAPRDWERPVLEVLGDPKLTVKAEESYDPYARREARGGGTATRTDLRKLSEWIKLMRELEERKRNGDAADED
jgi:hypothetical protein